MAVYGGKMSMLVLSVNTSKLDVLWVGPYQARALIISFALLMFTEDVHWQGVTRLFDKVCWFLFI